MRRANVQLQSDRRAEILAAAERCFVRSGFHQASMQEICIEAGMSPGNLYRYFPSKEAMIAGIAERDRAEVGQQFASADLSHGFFAVLEGMAHHHFSERTGRGGVAVRRDHGGEPPQSRRSPASTARSMPTCGSGSATCMRAAIARGDIPADVDFEGAVTMLMIIADGVWWRRALDPDFDPQSVLPLFMDVTRHMLRTRARHETATEEKSR